MNDADERDDLAQLEQVARRHLPPTKRVSSGDDVVATLIWAAARDRDGGWLIWDAEAERIKLDAVLRAAGELQRQFEALSPQMKRSIRQNAANNVAPPDWTSAWSNVSPATLAAALPHIRQSIAPAVAKAKAAARQTPAKGASDMRVAGVVHECRRAWQVRTGRQAPKSLRDPTEGRDPRGGRSTFGAFLSAVFLALDWNDKSLEAAMRAWRRVHDTPAAPIDS